MSIEPDTILVNRYQIWEQLSKKAGRRTFLALDLDSQNLVIIKILRFDPDFEWDDLKLFEREALTLKNLDHPAIPKYLDYFDLDEPDTRGFALVQTYIDAPSLETIIKSGQKFTELEAIELADRLLSILTYLHEQMPPVIHRDLKPSNILLTNRSGNSIGDVYLVDFGSVQTAASKEEGTITIVGTYGYIPLEQFGGQTTTASDLYSLGMTIIYLLTGTHPAELSLVNGRLKFTANISNHFDRWLLKMTQHHLDQRFDSSRSAQAALKSSNGSHDNIISLGPPGSQSKLYRDRSKLEIYLPRDLLSIKSHQSSRQLVKNISDKSEIWISSMWLLMIVIVFMLKTLSLSSFIGLSLIILIYLSVKASLFELYSTFITNYQKDKYCTLLVIEFSSIYAFELSNCGDKIKRVVAEDLCSETDLITYNPGYTFNQYINDRQQVVRTGLVVVKPELIICCDNNKYSLGNGLSQAELHWLGQELSDFLNVELQVIRPTPQVPPEEPSMSDGLSSSQHLELQVPYPRPPERSSISDDLSSDLSTSDDLSSIHLS